MPSTRQARQRSRGHRRRFSPAFSSKTLASFSIVSRFQAGICVGCSSCLVASSATVSWPLIASSATFALNSAENRLRVLMDTLFIAESIPGNRTTSPIVERIDNNAVTLSQPR